MHSDETLQHRASLLIPCPTIETLSRPCGRRPRRNQSHGRDRRLRSSNKTARVLTRGLEEELHPNLTFTRLLRNLQDGLCSPILQKPTISFLCPLNTNLQVVVLLRVVKSSPYCTIILLFYCPIVLLFYCPIVTFVTSLTESLIYQRIDCVYPNSFALQLIFFFNPTAAQSKRSCHSSFN